MTERARIPAAPKIFGAAFSKTGLFRPPTERKNTPLRSRLISEDTKRIAIVTGASRGIGRAIALHLARDQRHVVCVARTENALTELVEEINSIGGSAEAATCDVSDGDAVHALVEGVHDTHGRLDILVNNAGVTRDGLVLRMPDEHFDEVMLINLRSAFVACRAAARPMMRGRFGRIVNIGSVSGLVGNPGQANYAASKAALVGMSKSLAKELGAKGVTVNVVAPGFIQTQMTDILGDALMEEVAAKIPARRLGQPEEVAEAVSWLTSDQAGYITGQVLVVDGGLAM